MAAITGNWYKTTLKTAKNGGLEVYYGTSQYGEGELVQQWQSNSPILLENLHQLTEDGSFESWESNNDFEYGRIYLNSRFILSIVPLKKKPGTGWTSKLKKWVS